MKSMIVIATLLISFTGLVQGNPPLFKGTQK